MHRIVIIRPGQQPELPSRIVLGADERLDMTIVVLPGVSCDLPLAVDIEGEGANVNISGVIVSGSDEKVNIRVDLNHKVGRCYSNQIFKALAGGRSRISFHGTIVVAQDAQKTEAYQASHNLLLSDDAKVETEPQLEIYADDVKCSHGATIGRLNEEEQFYMRSRGISLKEARKLQMISFIAPVFDTIEDSSIKEEVRKLVEESINSVL